MDITLKSIGTIHTPYLPSLPIPHQPQQNAPGEFWISVDAQYKEALFKVEAYRYIYVLYYLDQVKPPVELTVSPSWAPSVQVGLFASRSARRPNPIGLSIVQIKEIEGSDIIISGIDVYNGTPLLDIKPYVRALDLKQDSNDGWYDELEDKDHLVAHMLGLPHEHSLSHGHSHGHGHDHVHAHTHNHKHAHNHEHAHLQVYGHGDKLKHD